MYNAGVLGHTCDVEPLPMRVLAKILNVNFIAGTKVTKSFPASDKTRISIHWYALNIL